MVDQTDRPAPSDDAQSTIKMLTAQRDFANEERRKLELTAALSTLAGFREACLAAINKLKEDAERSAEHSWKGGDTERYCRKGDDATCYANAEAAIRALPIPELWRPLTKDNSLKTGDRVLCCGGICNDVEIRTADTNWWFSSACTPDARPAWWMPVPPAKEQK